MFSVLAWFIQGKITGHKLLPVDTKGRYHEIYDQASTVSCYRHFPSRSYVFFLIVQLTPEDQKHTRTKRQKDAATR